jgi:hypothetical protein
MMTTPSRTCRIEGCTVEVPGVLDKEGLCLNHYLEEAFHRLGTATEDFHRGEDVDYPAMDWLLAQVDFAVEWLAEEDTDLDSDQRSRLLELLLGVANLNEYVRHSTVVARPSR